MCGREIKANVFNRHANVCGRTVERRPRVAWNKGLTNATDSRVAAISKAVSQTLTGRKGHPRTEEQKRFLSALQSARLKDGYANGTRRQVGGYCKWFEIDGVWVQGTWEFRTAKILSAWKCAGRIKNWEKCPYRIPYSVDGKPHTYVPDFLVTNLDGSEYILEVKGRKSLVDDIKWNAARASFDLVVWGLAEIQDNEREH
jgi:hypothetical protein